MAPRKISEAVRREKCRNKEARRAEQINGAFNSLLKSIPYIPETQRPTMPKIKTLRLAMKYIQHLSQILEGQWAFAAANSQENPRPLQFDDFKYIADGEIKVRNSYRERAQQTEMDIEVVHRIQQRTEAKRKQRCSETTAPTLLPQVQAQQVFYSTSPPTHPTVSNPFETYNMPPQYPALPRVDTVYGSCSPPDFIYQNPLMSDEEWRF